MSNKARLDKMSVSLLNDMNKPMLSFWKFQFIIYTFDSFIFIGFNWVSMANEVRLDQWDYILGSPCPTIAFCPTSAFGKATTKITFLSLIPLPHLSHKLTVLSENHYNWAKNKDNGKKLSGYDP